MRPFFNANGRLASKDEVGSEVIVRAESEVVDGANEDKLSVRAKGRVPAALAAVR